MPIVNIRRAFLLHLLNSYELIVCCYMWFHEVKREQEM